MPSDADLRTAWETYASIWKMTDRQARQAACEVALAPDCLYTDPLGQAQGWEALIDNMEDFHRQIPGGHFVTTSFQVHHGRSLATWNMVTGDGTVAGTGSSYASYDEHGKLTSMNGFFEVPATS